MAGIYNDMRITNISPKRNTASITEVSSGYCLTTHCLNPVTVDDAIIATFVAINSSLIIITHSTYLLSDP